MYTNDSFAGLEFSSMDKTHPLYDLQIPKEYIPGVTKGLEEMMTSGALAGFPVVDLVATLYDGSYHDVDSSVLAFQIAARQAFRYDSCLREKAGILHVTPSEAWNWDMQTFLSSAKFVAPGQSRSCF